MERDQVVWVHTVSDSGELAFPVGAAIPRLRPVYPAPRPDEHNVSSGSGKDLLYLDVKMLQEPFRSQAGRVDPNAYGLSQLSDLGFCPSSVAGHEDGV